MGKFLDVSPKFFFLADLSICLLTPSNIFSITSCCLALLLWLFRWDPGSQDRPREDKISLEKKDLSMTLKYLGRKTQFTYFTSLLKLSIIIILWYFPFERSHEVLIGTVKPVYKSLKEYHFISIFNIPLLMRRQRPLKSPAKKEWICLLGGNGEKKAILLPIWIKNQELRDIELNKNIPRTTHD